MKTEQHWFLATVSIDKYIIELMNMQLIASFSGNLYRFMKQIA
jgi:hypothetical protein